MTLQILLERKARRRERSARFFAKLAERAHGAGDRREAKRLGLWVIAKADTAALLRDCGGPHNPNTDALAHLAQVGFLVAPEVVTLPTRAA